MTARCGPRLSWTSAGSIAAAEGRIGVWIAVPAHQTRRRGAGKVLIPLDQLDERVGVIARSFGEMIGTQYGEGFYVREVLQIEDVVKLPLRRL